MKKFSLFACLIALNVIPLVSVIKRVRSKIKEKVVSLVSKLFSAQTQKEGVRPVQKAFRLRELFQTAGIGTIYGLLFASLLLMPFQSHRAIAADPPAEDNYEFHIIRIAWNADTERYESTNEEWNYYGNGYYPNYTAGSGPEGVVGDADTGREGFLITSGWTRNEDIMGAFDSRVTPNRRSRGIEDDRLVDEGDPGYDPIAYVNLDDISYAKHPTERRGVWTYTPRTTPTKFTQRISATVSQYKTIDASPKNTRYDGHKMGDNKSTLTWKKGETKSPPTARHRVENPDGTVIHNYKADEDVPLYYLYQHQETDDHN